MSPATRRRLVAALESTRTITPGFNNWLLFSGDGGGGARGAWARRADRVRDRVRASGSTQQWYVGDGLYGDGPAVPLGLLQQLRDPARCCSTCWPRRCRPTRRPGQGDARAGCTARARKRYAAIQERLISPEGTFPAIGRSICLPFRGRCHLLAQVGADGARCPRAVTAGGGAGRADGGDAAAVGGAGRPSTTNGLADASGSVGTSRGVGETLLEILPVFSVVAPCPRGASSPSVRRWRFTTGC